MGQYLLRHVVREEGKAAQAELFSKAAALAAAQEEAAAEAVAEGKARALEAAALLPGQAAVDLALADPATEVPSVYEAVLELVKLATGATHVYVGVKSTTEPEPGGDGDPARAVLTWLAGTAGSGMAGEALVGSNPDDDESVAEGVTFGLFAGAEPPEPAEGAPPLPDGADPLVYPTEVKVVLLWVKGVGVLCPTRLTPARHSDGCARLVRASCAASRQVVVPNVVRHPGMKFFGVPKMGAYVAVPIK